MIKRELYMSRIRPFIGGELIKVVTGIRRSGKSVMLELVKQELLESGVGAEHFISINFEDMRNAHLCNAQSLHEEVLRLSSAIQGNAQGIDTLLPVCNFLNFIKEQEDLSLDRGRQTQNLFVQ